MIQNRLILGYCVDSTIDVALARLFPGKNQ